MGLIENKINKAIEPYMSKVEKVLVDLTNKKQKENQKLMLKETEKMLQMIDEIVEQKVNEAIQKRV